MATRLNTFQILDDSISRSDLNSTIPGSAVIKKVVQGSNVVIASTGADSGTGDVTISVPTFPWNSILDKPNSFEGYGITGENVQARLTIVNDFLSNSSSPEFIFTWSGSGATASGVEPPFVNMAGVQRFITGSSSSARISVACTANSFMTAIKFGGGVANFYSLMSVPTLSSPTETYTIRAGFIDSPSGESVDGVFFRYTDGVNGGRWQAVTRSNSTETLQDTGVIVTSGAWERFQITVNESGTSASFMIGDAVVAVITTNIPVGVGRSTGYGLQVVKSVGTSSISALDCDFIKIDYKFTTPR